METPAQYAVGASMPAAGLSGTTDSAWPPPAWGMIRISIVLLAGAAIMICMDMLVYLRVWRDTVVAKGMPTPEQLLSMIWTGFVPLVLAGGSCLTALWASFRARGKYAVMSIMTATFAAIIVAILVIMVLVQWCPVALLQVSK